MNVPAACAVDGQGYATYFPLGDFEPPPPPPGPALSGVGKVLPQLDLQTRAVSVIASENDDTWEGVAPVTASGDVNVLVLPEARACALSTGVGARTGSTLGPIGPLRALLVGGDATGLTTPANFVVHLDTGVVEPVDARRELLVQRQRASVTPFGAGGLVAGGVALSSGLPTADAQVFDAGAGGFTTRLSLSEPRAGHAAVVLVDGRTLLVGGVGGADGETPVPRMEIVDPAGGDGFEENVALLSPVLSSPSAVRLVSGEVLVAGGTTVSGVAVTGLEWFTPQAGPSSVRLQTLPAGSVAARVALVALAGGGALAVVAPPASPPAGFQTTWVISADHAVAAGTSVQGSLTRPVLFGGAGGAPLLWSGDRWLQWQPWAGAFTGAPALDTGATSLGDATASPDPGLAMWLDPVRHQLIARRTDTTNAYSADAPLLVSGSGGVAPDRLPGAAGVAYSGGTGLTLAGGASAFVTDRTYADVALRVTYAAGQAPLVVLRDALAVEHVIDDRCCAGLFGATGPAPVVDVERRGASVTCAVDGAPPSACGASLDPSTRIALGVRGALATSPSVVSEILVQRLGDP